jgi:hypothetical protein
MPKHVRKAISSIEVTALGVTKVKFWNKNAALETLAKHLKLLTEHIELGSPGGAPLLKQPPVINYISVSVKTNEPVTTEVHANGHNGNGNGNGHTNGNGNGRVDHV